MIPQDHKTEKRYLFLRSCASLTAYFYQARLGDDSGQDLIEYALIAGVIGLAAVASAHGVAVSVSSAINIVSSQLTSAI
jgi:pilus assembly protein Flp/PilA